MEAFLARNELERKMAGNPTFIDLHGGRIKELKIRSKGLK